MIQLKKMANYPAETRERSFVKTVVYRIIIIIADFIFLYVLTRQVALSAFVMVVSNLYTAAGYYLYERIWNKISWGRIIKKK